MLKKLTLTSLCWVTISMGAQAADIYTNDFNSSFSDWSASGNVALSGTVNMGGKALRLKQTASAVKSVDTSGFSNVNVSMNLAASGLENGDECFAEINDGSGWVTYVQLGNGQDNKTFHLASSSATALSNNANVQIRFRSTGNQLGDYCWGENVSVTGDSGPVVTEPEIATSGSGSFAQLIVGSNATNTITVSNSGNADLLISSVVTSGDSAFSSVDNCATVAPSSSCSVDVTYAPVTVGSDSGTLTITSNDADEATINIALSGSATDSPPPPSGDLHVFTGTGNVNRAALGLTAAQLNGSSLSMMDFSAYSHGTSEINAANSNAAEPSNSFQGRLVLNNGNQTSMNFYEKGSGKGLAGSYGAPDVLPAFDFEFVQSGSHIIPKQRSLIITSHPDWEWIISPGRVWDENDAGSFSRVALPFALQEAGANCTHNGIMTFLFKNDGSISNVAVQVGAETCTYFNFEMWGLVSAQYISGSVSGAAGIISDYEDEVARRMPSKPLADIADDYPGVIAANFAAEQSSGETTHGVAIDGVHYAAACSTDRGDYPFCEVMALPSYSTAKSAVAQFAMAMLSQQDNGNVRSQIISDWVPECQNGINGTSAIWNDVTIEDNFDMATGNYRLSSYEGDEGGSNALNNFFLVFTHAQKIQHACERYIRKASPNTHFSYHSSDTYIGGLAMDAYSGSSDLFTDLVNTIYKPLGLSPVTYKTVRTFDTQAHPYWSHGMTWHQDDMVKLGEVISKQRGVINGQQMLDANIMDHMMAAGGDIGLETFNAENRYLNGMWTWDIGTSASYNCPVGTWVSYMSGFGGIGIVLLPNDMVYYFVSDSEAFSFNGAALELQKIRSLCP